jgi:hypothetical protein
MQRFGFLKYLVASTSSQRPSSAITIGRALLNAVSHKFPSNLNPNIKKYCDLVFSEQHYSALRSQIQKAEFQQSSGQIELELQDIYLSQDILPSHRGRIISEKEKDIYVFPTLAVSLGLLTPETFILTSRGRLFSHTVLPNEIKAFNRLSDINPLVISPRQTMVLLFSFLEADGDLINMLYPAILNKRDEFTDYDIGDIIGEQLADFLIQLEKSVSSIKDKNEIYKLKKTAVKIKSWNNKKYKGLGIRDEWATLRLEPFVDMGLLKKTDKFAYKYAFSENGRGFFSYFPPGQTIDTFLKDKFISASSQLFGIQVSPATDPVQILTSLKEANRILANNIGYSDITDTALLASMNLLHSSNALLEIRDSILVLKDAQKKNPHDIHFNIDRWGNLKFISFRRL